MFVRVVLAVLVIAHCVGCAQLNRINAQVPDRKRGTPSVARSLRNEGWSIPEALPKRRAKVETLVIDGLTVERQRLTPIRPIVDYELYYIYPDGSLRVTKDRRVVVGIWKYSRKGEAFAYSFLYSAGRDVAGVMETLFLDNDGDGRFEERLESAKLSRVPDWLQKP